MTNPEQALREQIALELMDEHCDMEAVEVVLGPVLHTVKRSFLDICPYTLPRVLASDSHSLAWG